MREYYRKTPQDKSIETKSVDNDVSFNRLGSAADFKNVFVSRLKDSNRNPDVAPYPTFNEELRNNFLDQTGAIDGNPEFDDINKQVRAEDFRNKYVSSFMLGDDEKVTPERTLEYLTGNPGDNLQNKFPTDGVATT